MANVLPNSISSTLTKIRKANPTVFEALMLGRMERSLFSFWYSHTGKTLDEVLAKLA